MDRACAHCGAAETQLRLCSACRAVRYCSAECQRAHWRDGHREDCAPRCCATLLTAAAAGDVRCVRYHLRREPERAVMARDETGRTPLILAAAHGHAAVVPLLLQHRPDEQVMLSDADGMSAMHMAAKNRHAPCVEALSAHLPCEQHMLRDRHGRTPLMYAVTGGRG